MKTVHELIQQLEALSPAVTGCNLTAEVADAPLSGDIRIFTNIPGRVKSCASTLQELVDRNGLQTDDLKTLAKGLASERNFYGSYSEIGCYRWFHESGANFQAQVSRAASEVLNPNGTELDGTLTSTGTDFDIKAFGMEQYIAKRFTSKLETELGVAVLLDGPIDVGTRQIEQFLFPEYQRVATELRAANSSRIPVLDWTFRKRHGSTMASEQEYDPYRFAERNRTYAFKSASQFSQTRPFVLVFAISARFNPVLATNFNNSTDLALRALARRTFIEFHTNTDLTTTHDDRAGSVTLGVASRSVSALLFIDVEEHGEARLFVNPSASRQFTLDDAQQNFDFCLDHHVRVVDDFVHDWY